ncbi:hypothetical protein DAEQUDRAFT_723103 [Daedalea quercina L-15889]|uniref:F-box domain-containing protein n=1 Tax=Daedalea quercina L-15889 TaxID=1314783 RepID=A0A165SRU7_9APHY|nr:hypothetical protein DAEQUDRAFT_723103 [Daedalea quercina L-15889]
MAPPDLPQEIYDVIISFLRLDPKSLATCSFVSRAWLHTTRTHKFRAVVLRSRKHCTRLRQTLDSPLLESNTIAECVRDVWVGVDSHNTKINDATLQRFWKDDRQLVPLLLRFQRTCSLQLENVMWTDRWLPCGGKDAILALSPGLVHLHLNRVVFDESDSVIRMLSASPALARLRMSFVSWKRRSRTVAQADTAQRQSTRMEWRLEQLVVDPWSYSALFSAAALYPQPLHVSVPSVEWVTSERPRNFVVSVLRAGEAISVFRRIQTAEATEVPDEPIQMGREEPWLSSVESVRVDISRPVSDKSANAFATQVPGLLYNIAMHRMEYDLGTFLSSSFSLSDRLDFPALDDELELLVSRRPEMVVTFRMRIQLADDNLWWADAEASSYTVAAQFSLQIPKLLALRTRVGVMMSFFSPVWPLGPHPVWKEVWWTQE